ncbi:MULTISPECIES: ABC transporter ATP-binding protein [Cryobacterium]|uniref:ABC transporter ATP-binding protein n=1 Tax=Cryobacterium breve TaxID=1259258 RepID=A0ABY2J4I3_9MICO|nr:MULTISPECIES: ABC transporter ATP-binding protein [Cryobacterium]TFC92148.1 ABC transporter ATP-binding protein [Cryobacterium sp. TmT3-12]TFC99847.1 ABC transporter ATP-binding protein [Cryobacterium breve]
MGRRAEAGGPRATFSQLVPYLLEHKKVLSFVVVLSILGALASLAQPLLVSQVITIVQEGDPLGGLVWALVALVVVSALISGYQHYLLQRTGEGVVLSSRRKLIGRMLRLPISEFDTRRTGDLVSRVGSDTTLLRAVLTQGLVEAIGGSLTFVGALIAMLVIDPVLLGLTVLVIAVSVVTVTLLSRRIRAASLAAQEKVGDLAASVERAISAVRTVRASNATDREVAAVEEDAKGAWRMGIQVAKISALVVPIAGIAMQVSFLVVLGVGGFRVASGTISVADLIAFILFLFLMIVPLGQAFGAITSVNAALGALGRIQEIIDLPSEDQFDRDIAPLAITVGAANESVRPDAPAISFENVQFGYMVAPVAKDAAAAAPDEGAVAESVGSGTATAPGTAATDDARAGSAGPAVSAGAGRSAHTASDAELAAAENAMIESAVDHPFVLETAIVVPAALETALTEPDLVSAELAAVEHAAAAQAATDAATPEAAQVADAADRATERADADAAGEPRPVLRGVSFSAPRGKRTALVGPSGAGKSTILALIERFYDPTDGVVRLGGLDIRTLDRTALRSQIGYVEQDAPVLAGSLRDNLTLSTPDATDKECIAVLHAVNLSEVLERDPAGLDAAVGESGVMLSGGERQRLAIARALLAAPPILLLDESTSSLDGVNEQKMRAAIDAVTVDRTLIVIAHRLSTVVDSDQIVVLDHGQVVGTGTHSELVASTPLYRELAKHQLLA